MQVFAKSDIGRERQINEDYYYIAKDEDKIKLYIIADGMGGYNAGEVASKLAVKSVKEYIYSNYDISNTDQEYIENIMRDAVKYANDVVYKTSLTKPELNGMGTTLDACLIYNNKVFIGHIGDSRVYRIRKDFVRKVTKDHSYVQKLIEDGTITKEEAYNHPKKNMLTKALGCIEPIEPDVVIKTFLKDDILVMTTDGLTNMIKEDEIFNIIKEDLNTSVENLVEKANDNGGYDNITVVIIK